MLTKSPLFFTWWGSSPTSGPKILARYLAVGWKMWTPPCYQASVKLQITDDVQVVVKGKTFNSRVVIEKILRLQPDQFFHVRYGLPRIRHDRHFRESTDSWSIEYRHVTDTLQDAHVDRPSIDSRWIHVCRPIYQPTSRPLVDREVGRYRSRCRSTLPIVHIIHFGEGIESLCVT